MKDLSNIEFINIVQRVVDSGAKLDDLFVDQLFERFERIVSSIRAWEEKTNLRVRNIHQTIDNQYRHHCNTTEFFYSAFEFLKDHNN